MSDITNGRFLVRGGNPIRGEIEPQGNKNEAMPLMAATCLTDQPVTFQLHLRQLVKSPGELWPPPLVWCVLGIHYTPRIRDLQNPQRLGSEFVGLSPLHHQTL